MKTLNSIILLLVCFLFTLPAQSQVITNTPTNESNNRFFSEVFTEIKRPALSIIGFDNGGNHGKGNGLKQVLNQAYIYGSNEQKDLILDILDISKEDIIPNPVTRNDYQVNSNRLQYKAFEALARYVLEKNGVTAALSNSTYGIPIRTHSVALAAFKSDILALADAPSIFINNNKETS